MTENQALENDYDLDYEVVSENGDVYHVDDYLDLVHGLVCGLGLDCEVFKWNENTNSYDFYDEFKA